MTHPRAVRSDDGGDAQERATAALEAECAELTKALTGLTCGGSEFFVRKGERFTADIPACLDYIRRSREGQSAVLKGAILAKQGAQATAADLLEALKAIAGREGECGNDQWDPVEGRWRPIRDIARAAIAKAENPQ